MGLVIVGNILKIVLGCNACEPDDYIILLHQFCRWSVSAVWSGLHNVFLFVKACVIFKQCLVLGQLGAAWIRLDIGAVILNEQDFRRRIIFRSPEIIHRFVKSILAVVLVGILVIQNVLKSDSVKNDFGCAVIDLGGQT
ncbi:hypothetical protein D3C73_902020 [compost metagenome]